MLKRIYEFLFVDDLLAVPVNTAPVKAGPLGKKLMKDLACLTLFSYLLLIFNPVMPLVADKMAHTFWEEYHLITVHHVYGSTHLQKDLSDNAKQADKDKSSGSSKSGSDDSSHLIFPVNYDFQANNAICRFYFGYKINPPVSYPDSRYRPPRA